MEQAKLAAACTAFMNERAEALKAFRRDIHSHPETGWLEYRTAAILADKLEALGYTIVYGADAIDDEARMGLPSEEAMSLAAQRALDEGAPQKWVGRFALGHTSFVATMRFGDADAEATAAACEGGASSSASDGRAATFAKTAGPTVAFRFDMDANDCEEANCPEHGPCATGFASTHSGAMHACGHDGHVTMGLALAQYLVSHKEELSGSVRLIFQAAEEGVRGAKSMMKAGVVDGVDYFFGCHLGITETLAHGLACMDPGFLATTKWDVRFHGEASHAGSMPERGRNALLSAASAAVNLATIPVHSGGQARCHVGKLEAGTVRNAVADYAYLAMETRGSTTEINDYVVERARAVLEGAATMYGCTVDIEEVGSAPQTCCDEGLAHDLYGLAEDFGCFDKLVLSYEGGGSEDCAYFLERVAQQGGKATYMIIGSPLTAPHHNPRFTFDEEDMVRGAAWLAFVAHRYLREEGC